MLQSPPTLAAGLSQPLFSKGPIFSQLNICILGVDWLIAAFISYSVPTLHLKQQRSPVEWPWGHFQLQALFFPTPDKLFPNMCWKTFFPVWVTRATPPAEGRRCFSGILWKPVSPSSPARMFLTTGISQQELSGHGSELQTDNGNKIPQIPAAQSTNYRVKDLTLASSSSQLALTPENKVINKEIWEIRHALKWNLDIWMPVYLFSCPNQRHVSTSKKIRQPLKTVKAALQVSLLAFFSPWKWNCWK